MLLPNIKKQSLILSVLFPTNTNNLHFFLIKAVYIFNFYLFY
jgi:hypothetical protein